MADSYKTEIDFTKQKPIFFFLKKEHQLAEREGFEPSKRFNTFIRFPSVRLQPLGHLSLKSPKVFAEVLESLEGAFLFVVSPSVCF